MSVTRGTKSYVLDKSALLAVSVADSWIIATALENGAPLVHKDPEFEQVKDRLSLFPLPYKK